MTISRDPPVTGDQALEQAAKPYSGEKGNLEFPMNRAIPYKLIAKIAKFRASQVQAKKS